MSDDLIYDVAVVGGGLAGLSLAIQCADQNLRVVLFEKEEYPYHKVCGEYISLESWNFLQNLGVPLKELGLPIIKKLDLSDNNGRKYSFKLPLGGFGISRFSLDFALYKIAVAKGVSVFTNNKVSDATFADELFTVTSTYQKITARVAAGCFGKRSNLDVKWKRPFITEKPGSVSNYIGVKYHTENISNTNTISLHNFHNGYCGFSQIEDGKSCLCYLTTAKNLKDCGNSISQMQKRVLYKNPILKEIFSSAKFLYEEPLVISQISFAKKKQVENHVLMLGDAAGMITPLCGNGMSMALHSSKIAFNAVRKFLAGETAREKMEKEYETCWKSEFSKRLWIGRNVQRLFGGNTTTSLFLKGMHACPPIANVLIRSTHGQPF